jgi:ABC-type multidrug transport system permease subunit
MRAISAIKKEMLEIAHDRTMLAVLLVFPVLVMLFMGSSFRSLEINGLPIGLAGPANTTFSQALFSGLNESKAFKLMSYPSEEDAMTAFRNGQLRAVIVVPDDFESTLRAGSGSTIKIVVDNSDIALEQSVLAAMSSVIQASSADITKTYVSAAWEDLKGLNSTASGLAGELASTKAQMEQTRESVRAVKVDIADLDIGSLESSIDSASSDIAGLQASLFAQKERLRDASNQESALFNQTDIFLANASSALDRSLETVQSTHVKLQAQAQDLQTTISTLSASISGLEALRAGATDPAMIAALDFNIASLRALRDSSTNQLAAAEEQMLDLESLNSTLLSSRDSLEIYSSEVESARSGTGDLAEMELALDSASMRLSAINSSFAGAREDISDLRTLLGEMDSTATQIDWTIGQALSQLTSFETLIDSLESTVAEQTGKNPDLIASPLSVTVKNQYERASFVDFIMPQVIAVSLLLSSFLLSSISLVREKTRRTIVRALMSPGSLANLVFGKIATLVFLSFVQVGIIVIVALLLFGVKPPSDVIALLGGTAISSLVLCSIGVIIGFYAKSESSAIQGCLMLAIPMLFLGNIIFSSDLLPSYTQILQQLLPLAHVTSIFRIVLITNGNPIANIAALLSYFVLLASILSYIVMTRKDITQYQ